MRGIAFLFKQHRCKCFFWKKNKGKDIVKTKSYSVSGGIYTSKRIGASQVNVQLVDKSIGKDIVLGGTSTDQNGQFNISFNYKGKDKPDLQVLAISAEEKVLGRSEIHYTAGPEEKIDLILSAANDPVATNEFQKLNSNLTQHLSGAALKDLREDDEKTDISYLAGKTSIDARLIGMTTLAHEYGEKNQLPPDLYYALFRAGQPTDEVSISKIHPNTVTRVMEKAIEGNVISAEHKKKIPEYVSKFEDIGVSFILDNKIDSSVSSVGEFLGMTLEEEQEKTAFVKLYRENQSDLDGLWQKATDSFGEEKTKQLRLDGKLGLMTLNNEPLIRKLRAAGHIIEDPVELVRKGFYKTEQWDNLLTNDIPVPPTVQGDNTDEQKKNYARLMATQLKLSYPTTVLAQQINSDEITLTDDTTVKEAAIQFLDRQQEDFEIGKTPLTRYIKDNDIQLHKDTNIHDATLSELKRLERVYQISPSDKAMSALLDNGLDSAFAVTNKYSNEQTFLAEFSEPMGGENVARMTYAKSNMVAGAVMNVALAYGTHRRNPSIYAVNAKHELHKDTDDTDLPGADDVIVSPTLEELFDEMDYCECEHCRSVLSPAAYLVDLLKFIDRNENLAGKENPYEALKRRRPDIENIELTCENTNTVLPYIDLVNEILEYFVVNETLSGFEGHNVEEGEKSEDLLASPQFVEEQAYQTLSEKVYPLKLPFDYSLETLRTYFEHLKVPLWEAMKYLRTNDSMTSSFTTDTPHLAPYGWNGIYTEYLGLTPQQYNILTNNTHDIAQYYGEANGTDLNKVLSANNNYAQKLTRKLGITYKELVTIIKTRFINPYAHLIDKLEKLKVGFPVLIDYINSNGDNDFTLPPEIDASKYDGDVKAWLLKQDTERGIDNPAHIRRLILLTDPTGEAGECDFVPLQLRYADQSLLEPIEYWKLMRFIRLWKALGWSIEQTDMALSALYEKSSIPSPNDPDAISKLNKGFSSFIVRVAQAKEVMERLKMRVKRDLGKVLSFWSNIDTYGSQSLYKQLFLNPAIKKIDSIFEDDGYNQYLQDSTPKLSKYVPAILAALNINEESFQLLLTALSLPDELTLDNLSELFRYTSLSRALHISVQELLMIRDLSGISNPFKNIGAFPNSTIQFIEIVEMVKEAGFKIPNLKYLLTHEDIGGKASPTEKDILDFAKTVRTNLLTIEQENQEGLDDPTGELARAKLTQAYGQDFADQFFGLIEGTTVFSVDYDNDAEVLESSIRAISSQIRYDHANKRISFDGTMTEEEKVAYLEIEGTSQGFKDVITALYTAQGPSETDYGHGSPELEETILAVSSRISYDDFAKKLSFQGVMSTQTKTFFESLPTVPEPFKTAIGQLFTLSQGLFEQLPDLGNLYQTQFESLNAVAKKAAYGQILSWLLPILKPQLKRLALRESLGSSLSVDADMLITLVETPEVIHAVNEAEPLMNDLYAIESKVGFTEDSSVEGQKRFRAYVEPSTSEFFNFYIETDANVDTVSMNLGAGSISGTLVEGVWTNDTAISLKAGELSLLEITLKGTTNATINAPIVKWATGNMGKGNVPLGQLYSFEQVEIFQNAYLRLLKSIALIENLSLSSEEVTHFSQFTKTVNDNPKSINWLNGLLSPTQNTAATIQEVFMHFQKLAIYVQLRDTLNIEGKDFISILKDPQLSNESGENSLLKETKWSLKNREALLKRFGWNVADLSDPARLKRLNDAFELITKTGLSASLLLDITTISPSTQNISDLQAALRAKYDIIFWREVIQPINDHLRTQQRDALVAYLLFQLSQDASTMHLNTSEKLFEYLLIDVEMDSCMKTSRIKQALSSVQLFIHRCLLNLEKNVSPGALNAKQWDWMKRYRVWEANRKVFLWPENWLEPELRDNKSPFFQELESELLQSDITEESAATALLNYLEKLDGVAKLEICAMHVQENQIKKDGVYYSADDIVHVFGRTPGANRKYYYRRFEYGYWTPWEKVDLDIEDNPILPVVWKDRLFLFWLNLIQKGKENKNSLIKKGKDNEGQNSDRLVDASIDSTPPESGTTTDANLSWSEYFNGKWQPRRTSDFNQPIQNFFSGTLDRSRVYLEPHEGEEGELIINVWDKGKLTLFNKHSIPQKGTSIPIESNESKRRYKGRVFYNNFGSRKAMSIGYYSTLYYPNYINGMERLSKIYNEGDLIFNNEILSQNPLFPIFPRQRIKGNLWEIPFFFQNGQHVFYVEPTESIHSIPKYNDILVLATQPEFLELQIEEIDEQNHDLLPESHKESYSHEDVGHIPPPFPADTDLINPIIVGTTFRFRESEIGSEGISNL